jgi:hypothetical protein
MGALSTANSSVLVTSAGGTPSLSTTLPSGISATNMTLTTPNIGAATATSINFGGSTLSTYAQSTSWTPAIDFATHGDLSVSYGSQSGTYSRIGNIVVASFSVTFTPTYTTASGLLHITGLPFTVGTTGIGMTNLQGPAYPTGTTNIFLQAQIGQTYILLGSNGTLVATAYFSTTQITTGLANVAIQGTVTYLV